MKSFHELCFGNFSCVIEEAWDERSGLRDGACRSANGPLLLSRTSKKCTSGLWSGECLSEVKSKEGPREK